MYKVYLKAFAALFVFLLFVQSGQAQREEPKEDPKNCEDFNNQSTAGWSGTAVGIGLGQPGPSNTFGDFFMTAEDLSGPSTLNNASGFDGDWSSMGGCLCYDFRIVDGKSATFAHFQSIIINSGGLQATFDVNFTVNENDGWVKICIPTNQCSGADLPSNSFGGWTMTSGASTCANWNALITNVQLVRFTFDDLAGPGEVVGYDNICFGPCIDDGFYCCRGARNLIFNGNFELGNTGFFTQYGFQQNLFANSVAPGQFGVGNSAEAALVSPNWLAQDHSGCVGFPNTEMMLVNGRTQQSSNTGNIVWQQTINGLTPGGEYTFCGQFKNLPTCAFDILPRVSVTIFGGQSIPFTTINTAPGLCDWQELSSTFTITGTQVTIRIQVDHLGNGDGNDLAIDDLALQFKEPAPVPFWVGTMNTPPGVEASYNQQGNQDDFLVDASCGYFWTVTNLNSGTVLGTGNAQGNSNTPAAWNLSTDFPSINFIEDVPYSIELTVTRCECNADNTRRIDVLIHGQLLVRLPEGDHSESKIRELIAELEQAQGATSVQFFPNPTTGSLKALTTAQKLDLQLVDMSGRVLEEWSLQDGRELDISKFSSGIYYLKYNADGVNGVSKIVLQ